MHQFYNLTLSVFQKASFLADSMSVIPNNFLKQKTAHRKTVHSKTTCPSSWQEQKEHSIVTSPKLI